MWDNAAQSAIHAIDGLARRADARAHNIANAQMPNFRAQHVDFEGPLRAALQRGDASQAGMRVVATESLVDANGNSVDLETELVGTIKDALQRNAMVAAFNFKTGQIRIAINGHR